MYLHNLLPVRMQPVRLRYYLVRCCLYPVLGAEGPGRHGSCSKGVGTDFDLSTALQECGTFSSHSRYINRAKIRANGTSQAQHHPQGLSGFLAAGAKEGTAMLWGSDAGAPTSYQAAPNILHTPEPGLSESHRVFLDA